MSSLLDDLVVLAGKSETLEELMIVYCEEHDVDVIVVYQARTTPAPCPVCARIEELKVEIENLKVEVTEAGDAT